MNFFRRLLIPTQPILGRWNSVVKKENTAKFMDQGNYDYCYQNIKLIRYKPLILDKKSIEKLINYFNNNK